MSRELPRPTRPGLFALLAIAALLVLSAGWFEVGNYRDHQQAEDDRADVLAVAKQQVTELTTLSADNIESQVTAMMGRTTGDFRDQFQAIADTFIKVVTQDEIKAVGEISAAGVVSLQENTAEVLVASTAEVSSKAKKEVVSRSYRMTVSLAKEDDKWLVSGMTFVP